MIQVQAYLRLSILCLCMLVLASVLGLRDISGLSVYILTLYYFVCAVLLACSMWVGWQLAHKHIGYLYLTVWLGIIYMFLYIVDIMALFPSPATGISVTLYTMKAIGLVCGLCLVLWSHKAWHDYMYTTHIEERRPFLPWYLMFGLVCICIVIIYTATMMIG